MPPENAEYLYAAYGAALAIYGLYGASLWRRRRRVQQRLRQIDRAAAQ